MYVLGEKQKDQKTSKSCVFVSFFYICMFFTIRYTTHYSFLDLTCNGIIRVNRPSAFCLLGAFLQSIGLSGSNGSSEYLFMKYL